MSLNLEMIQNARKNIAFFLEPTPLLRLPSLDDRLGCQVYVKAECLQLTGAFKLRGAMNKMLQLTPNQAARGFVAASSGNHGKAVAYVASLLGEQAAIVIPQSAAAVKVEAIRELGAEIIQCDTAARFAVAEQICRERQAVLVHPFDDEDIMAGQGTTGLEIMEQCPELNKIIVPTSGGGLLGGVAAAVKAIAPTVRVFGAEPAVLPRYSASLAAGRPVVVEQRNTIADALLAQTPGSLCFQQVAANAAGVVDVADSYILQGMKLLLMSGKLLAEPSACIGLGAVLQGLIPVQPAEKVCFIISGGSVGYEQLKMLDDVEL